MGNTLPVLRNLIGGSYVDPAGGATSPVIDPCTGEAYALAPVSAAGDVDAAMAAASKGFEAWRETTPAERQRALLRIADAVEARADELIAAECRNTGKPVEATRREEMAPLLDELRFFAGAARMLDGRSAGEYLREPVGPATVEEWYGWRPMTPDDLPILGRAPGIDNLVLATGHGMLGVSMSAITGVLVCDVVTGRTPSLDLAPYAATRFA